MKKNLLILALALTIALPVFGLAAEVTTAPATTAETTATTPYGGQYGRRWNQQPVTPATAPQTNYEDADGDGICDNCGQAQGTNPAAPGYVDADGNGVCDHLGTAQQGQAFGRGQMLRGQGRNQRSFGQAQGMMAGRQAMMGRGPMGNTEGRNYVDADNNGVCDNLGTAPSFGPGQPNVQPGPGNFGPGNMGPGNFGPGRNRR